MKILRELVTKARSISDNITNGNRSDARKALLALPPAHVAYVVCLLVSGPAIDRSPEDIMRLVASEL